MGTKFELENEAYQSEKKDTHAEGDRVLPKPLSQRSPVMAPNAVPAGVAGEVLVDWADL